MELANANKLHLPISDTFSIKINQLKYEFPYLWIKNGRCIMELANANKLHLPISDTFSIKINQLKYEFPYLWIKNGSRELWYSFFHHKSCYCRNILASIDTVLFKTGTCTYGQYVQYISYRIDNLCVYKEC